MWTCPMCNRGFKRTSQPHTCRLIDPEDLFSKRPPHLKKLFLPVLEFVKSLGIVRQEAVLPDVIFFKTVSTFLAVKVKKDHLDIEFFLDRIEANPPVSKYLQTSRYRVAHIVPIDDRKEFNKQLKDWIRESYRLISEKKGAARN
jgi:hypothetical protein